MVFIASMSQAFNDALFKTEKNLFRQYNVLAHSDQEMFEMVTNWSSCEEISLLVSQGDHKNMLGLSAFFICQEKIREIQAAAASSMFFR